jgi:hypothetical protein
LPFNYVYFFLLFNINENIYIVICLLSLTESFAEVCFNLGEALSVIRRKLGHVSALCPADPASRQLSPIFSKVLRRVSGEQTADVVAAGVPKGASLIEKLLVI